MLANTSGDIYDSFVAKHQLVCNQLGRFSFSTKAFRPDESKKSVVHVTSGGSSIGQTSSVRMLSP